MTRMKPLMKAFRTPVDESFSPTPMQKKTMDVATAIHVTCTTKCSTSSSMLERTFVVAEARPAILPIMVLSPMRITTPRASPFMTSAELKTRLRASAGAGCCMSTKQAMASGSPVMELISTLRSLQSKRRRSAGTRSPRPRRTMSPMTRSSEAMRCSRPLRTIVVCAGSSFVNMFMTSAVWRCWK